MIPTYTALIVSISTAIVAIERVWTAWQAIRAKSSSK